MVGLPAVLNCEFLNSRPKGNPMKIEELRRDIANLQADRTAMVIILTALMQTHQDHTAMQLRLTSLLEQQLCGGALGNTLTPEQNERVRYVVEWLQTARTAIAPTSPPQQR
jgi:hypothetical protein